MPKPFPKEFRDDVVATALRRESSFAQIAKDFGISVSCVQRWVAIADSRSSIVDSVGIGDLYVRLRRHRCLLVAASPGLTQNRIRNRDGERPPRIRFHLRTELDTVQVIPALSHAAATARPRRRAIHRTPPPFCDI